MAAIRKAEAEKIVRSESRTWYASMGRPDDPSFSDFAKWLQVRHPAIFSFKSVMGPYEDLEMVWADELQQTWRY